MRVLGINDYSRPGGGAEIIWRRSHDLLLGAGIDSRVLAADTVVRRRTPWSYVYSKTFAAALRDVVREWRPHVVHLHNYYHLCSPSVLDALARARRAGEVGSVVATAHDFHLLSPSPGLLRRSAGGDFRLVDPAAPPGPRQKLAWRWHDVGWHRSALRAVQHVYAYDIRRWQRVIDVVLCPSEFLAGALSPALNTEVLANPAPAPLNVRKGSSKLTALYAGRIVPEKGVAEFLELAPRSFLDHLIVAGSGTDEDRARRVASERGLATTFLGRVSRAEVFRHLEQAHIAVLPSRCYENAPTVLFEGLSRGANFMASDLPGVREIARGSATGFLFDPWNAESIEEAVEEVDKAFARGELNDFDATDYLLARSDDRYLQGLLDVYRRVSDE